MEKELQLLGLEPAALIHEELGEEDARYLGHTVGLFAFLQSMEKQGKEIFDIMKLASMVIEASLRNIYGCPLTVSYWSPPKSKIGYIRMTNPNFQLISLIALDFGSNQYTLSRFIANYCFAEFSVMSLEKVRSLIHEALEWTTIPPNPQTPLFFNKTVNTCVFVDYNATKVFTDEKFKTYSEGELTPSWAKHIADTWKTKHVTAVHAELKNDVYVFNKLNALPPKVPKIIVLEA